MFQELSSLLRPLFLLALILFFMADLRPVHSQETVVPGSFASMSKEIIPINMLVAQSRVIDLDKPVSRVSISNPEIAEAILIGPTQILVNGKAFGKSNIIAWEKKTEQFLVFDVFVRANLSLLDAQIRALFPKDDIRLSQANSSVVISGSVSDPKISAQVDQVVQAAGLKTVNMLQSPVKSATQVQLQVRVAEVSRNRLKDFAASPSYQPQPGLGGYSNPGSGPYTLNSAAGGQMVGSLASTLNLFMMGGDALLFLRALQTQGAMRALAEPNLIAMDGQQASFLAGGEFPIPMINSGGGTNSNVSINFKEYGVRLSFKPTIIDEDHIRLELEPEVSTIDWANGVKFEGFHIPAVRTRRAKTGVELRDGQSFALAGLIDNNEMRSLAKVPMIGDIPILGSLFKSKSFQKNETELMLIVTAQLVNPVNSDALPRLRGIDGLNNGSPLGVEAPGEEVMGESGHSLGSGKKTNESPKKAAPERLPETTPSTPAQILIPDEKPGKDSAGTVPGFEFNDPAPAPQLEPKRPLLVDKNGQLLAEEDDDEREDAKPFVKVIARKR
jgi:pilus assembly protein CpaC